MGGALALFPPIVAALYSNRERLAKVSNYAMAAVAMGFMGGWGAAIYGKVIHNPNLIFLSPGISITISGAIICVGFLLTQSKYQNSLRTS